jgi:hypothetical protein
MENDCNWRALNLIFTKMRQVADIQMYVCGHFTIAMRDYIRGLNILAPKARKVPFGARQLIDLPPLRGPRKEISVSMVHVPRNTAMPPRDSIPGLSQLWRVWCAPARNVKRNISLTSSRNAEKRLNYSHYFDFPIVKDDDEFGHAESYGYPLVWNIAAPKRI